MPKRKAEQTIAKLVGECVDGVIRDLGFQARKLESEAVRSPDQKALAVRIRFGNDEVQGGVTLQATHVMFQRLFPRDPQAVVVGAGTLDLSDWAREVANLIVGRFRNRASQYGLLVAISCPENVSLDQLVETTSGTASRIPLVFAIAAAASAETCDESDQRLDAWLELSVADGVSLSESPVQSQDDALFEGDTIIF